MKRRFLKGKFRQRTITNIINLKKKPSEKGNPEMTILETKKEHDNSEKERFRKVNVEKRKDNSEKELSGNGDSEKEESELVRLCGPP